MSLQRLEEPRGYLDVQDKKNPRQESNFHSILKVEIMRHLYIVKEEFSIEKVP